MQNHPDPNDPDNELLEIEALLRALNLRVTAYRNNIANRAGPLPTTNTSVQPPAAHRIPAIGDRVRLRLRNSRYVIGTVVGHTTLFLKISVPGQTGVLLRKPYNVTVL